MRIKAEHRDGSLTALMHAIEGDMADEITQVMREETHALASTYRDQVRAAGLGNRLANTWRAEIYPMGRRSLSPAGYIWSAAPEIVDSFVRGASIRPVNGAKWMWIPTRAVPRRRSGGNYSSNMARRARGSAMTPEEVELHFNAELEIVFEGRQGFAFIDVISGLSGGYRQATAGRLKGRRGIAPRRAKRVLMFTLVRGVKMPRLLELEGPAEKAAAAIVQRIERRWS